MDYSAGRLQLSMIQQRILALRVSVHTCESLLVLL